MPVRHFLLYTLFLLTAALGPLPAAAQVSPTSRWWYPMGTAEGTRSNIDSTLEADTVGPTVKWRAPALRNAPAIAVGHLLNRGGGIRFQQQVVGITADTLLILSGLGTVEQRAIYGDTAGLFPKPYRLSLTGLFSLGTGTVSPLGRANVIGVGVERAQQSLNDTLWAFLADVSGRVTKRIILDSLPSTQPLALRRAGLYPVAVFGKAVYMAVSQNDDAATSSGAVANAIAKESFSSDQPFFENTTSKWSYAVGPRVYPQAPSLTYDVLTNRNYIALSTATYNSPVQVIARPPTAPPTSGVPTASDSMYAINLTDTLDAPRNVQTRRVPVLGPAVQNRGESNSYFITLFAGINEGGTFFRAITENHDPSRPGTAKLTLASPFTSDTITYGSYTDPEMVNVGWTIATGDVDGSVPDRTAGNPNAQKYRNNKGEELIGARRNADGSDVANNYLYFFRWSYIDTTGDKPISLQLVFRHAFSGRLLAAGDLHGVMNGDTYARRELVIAQGNTIKVLQLIPYNDPSFGDFRNEYFRTVATYTLDAPALTAAIADLEGDGANDLIVTTAQSTYAIGRPVPQPFGTIASDSDRYCRGKQVKVRWNRKVGGGENGVRLTLIGGSGPRPVAYAYHSASPDPLNIGAGADSITIDTRGIQPGSYRLVVQDTIVAAIVDTSNLFTIDQTLFENVSLDTSSGVGFGRPFTLSADVECSAGLWVVRSFDGTNWDTLKTLPVSLSNGSASAIDRIDCPLTNCSGVSDTVRVFYRFADTNRFGESEIRAVEIPIQPRTLAFSGTETDPRMRTITWGAGDYQCSTPRIYLVDANGATVREIAQVPPGSTEYSFTIPDEISGTLQVRICCSDAPCIFGMSSEFDVPPVSNKNYVAPNPFDPNARGADLNGAVIVYRLKNPGDVTITIYDAGRAVVRKLLDAAPQEPRVHRVAWDGRNSRGDIVASGSYICIIESSSGEHYVLPIIVNKH